MEYSAAYALRYAGNMIDSHCHLDLPAFEHDLNGVLKRAGEAGVSGFLIPGTTPAGWEIQLAIQARHSDIFLAFGIHPWFIRGSLDDAVSKLQKAVTEHRKSVCAIGEIGLDATIELPLAEQEKWLLAQLDVAKQCELPVVLHHLKTHHRLPAMIKQAGFSCGGVVHAFSGNAQVAAQYLDLGFKLGAGGTITYPRGKKTLDALVEAGLDNILLETDSPDMPVQGFQGQRNEPARLVQIAQVLAEAFGVSVAEVTKKTTANFRDLFVQP